MGGPTGIPSAFAAGRQMADQQFAEKRKRAEELDDEKRQAKALELYNERQNLVTLLNAPNLSDSQKAGYHQLLADTQQKWDDIYRHPVHGPNWLQRDFGFIKGLITRKPYDPNAKPQQEMAQRKEQATKEADAYASAMAPLSPEQQAAVESKKNEAWVNANVDLFKRTRPDASPEEVDRYKTTLLEMVAGMKQLTGTAAAYKPTSGTLHGVKTNWMLHDGRYYVPGSLEPVPDQDARDFIPDATKPTKLAKGGVAPSRQSSTGYIQLWVDPYHPGDRSKWEWNPIGATRYNQIIQSKSTETDPFGVVSTTLRETGPKSQGFLDLTDVPQGSGNDEGDVVVPGAGGAAPAPTAAPPTATPKTLRQQVPAPPHRSTAPSAGAKHPAVAAARVATSATDAQTPETYNKPLPLDAAGHVPASAPMNPYVKAMVDRLLDGADIDKLGIPSKDRGLVASVAQQYGWEQGLFTPKEKLLIREAGSYLKSMRSSPSLKVLDSFVSREKIHNAIKAADDKGGIFSTQISLMFGLNSEEQDFLQRFLQARGTVSGLSQLTRGGRTTEAGIRRLQAELPDPLTVHSGKDAQTRLDRLLSEIDVAQQQGFIADVESNPSVDKHVDTVRKLLNYPGKN